jgi:hypothetical protein
MKEAQLIALTNIMGGLLASGHYTRDIDANDPTEDNGPALKRFDHGNDWKGSADVAGNELLCRMEPYVIMDAFDLLEAAERALK